MGLLEFKPNKHSVVILSANPAWNAINGTIPMQENPGVSKFDQYSI